MLLLDHFIRTADDAEVVENFMKRMVKRFLILALILGAFGVASIHFVFHFVLDRPVYLSPWMLVFYIYLLIPAGICLVLALLSYVAAKYIHPKRYELPKTN